MLWRITAEHCWGKSVDHPCRKGVFSDPTDGFELEVEAADEDAARDAGVKALERIVQDAPVCDCQRQKQAGSRDWWESVCVSAMPIITVRYWRGTTEQEATAYSYAEALEIAGRNENAYSPTFWHGDKQLRDDGYGLAYDESLASGKPVYCCL